MRRLILSLAVMMKRKGAMKLFSLVAIFLFVFMLVLLNTTTANPDPSCGSTITQNTTLTSDLICSGSALIIGADNIILDCNGYAIAGPGSAMGLYDGIALTGKTGNTIKNCNIRGFYTGISLEGSSSNNIIESNTLYSNQNNIWVYFSYSNIIRNNNINIGSTGIDIKSSNSNTISGNTIMSIGAYGAIVLESGASYNLVTNNTLNSNSRGVNVNGASYNNITNNQINNNYELGGILLTWGASNNIVEGNTITGNKKGIYLLSPGASNNYIIRNTVTDNTEHGIYLTSTSNNNIIYNNLFNNIVNSEDLGVNSWNITKTLGTNIRGDPYLGGNFWSDYVGADTNGDGLGDTLLPYSSNGKIVNGGDDLPLTTRATESVSCTDSDGGRNYTVKGTTTGYYINDTYGTFTDYCDSDWVWRLFEFNCNATGSTQQGRTPYISKNVWSCDNGCQDGACIPNQACPTCQSPSAWSTCVNNNQTRTNYRCSANTNYQCQAYTEAQYCTVPSPTPLPDLIVENAYTQPQNLTKGSQFSIYASVKNIGSSSSGQSEARFYYNTSETNFLFGNLSAGQSTGYLENSGLQTVKIEGANQIRIVVDPFNSVNELNESNNEFLLSFNACPTCQSPSAWSTCVNNNQTRTNYRCSANTNYQCQAYTEAQYCTVPSPTPAPAPTPPSAGGGGGGGGGGVVIPTCKGQGAAICNINETCLEKWLTASDTDRCCSKLCVPIAFNKTEVEKKVEELSQTKQQTPQAAETSIVLPILESVKTNITNPEHINKIEQVQVETLEVTKHIASFENQTKTRGMIYSIKWLFGFVEEQEKRDSQFLESRSAELLTISNTLKSVAEDLDDINAKNIILGQVEKLKLQADELNQKARQKRENTQGLISWIKNLFGITGSFLSTWDHLT